MGEATFIGCLFSIRVQSHARTQRSLTRTHPRTRRDVALQDVDPPSPMTATERPMAPTYSLRYDCMPHRSMCCNRRNVAVQHPLPPRRTRHCMQRQRTIIGYGNMCAHTHVSLPHAHTHSRTLYVVATSTCTHPLCTDRGTRQLFEWRHLTSRGTHRHLIAIVLRMYCIMCFHLILTKHACVRPHQSYQSLSFQALAYFTREYVTCTLITINELVPHVPPPHISLLARKPLPRRRLQ